MESIVLFYSAQLPSGSAGATRVVTLAKLVKASGYHPVMLGLNFTNSNVSNGLYEGIEYDLISGHELSMTGIRSIQRERKIRKKLETWLELFQSSHIIKTIILTEMQGYSKFFIDYSRMSKIPVCLNVVEWYSKNTFPGVLGLFRYFKHQADMYFFYPKLKNVIAISQFLTNHFEKRECNVIRIPTIVDITSYHISREVFNENLILLYAGIPWGKDEIGNVIEAIALLDDSEKSKVEFRIYGVRKEEFQHRIKLSKNASNLFDKNVFCMGKIPSEHVKNRLQEANFTILLRRKTKKSMAGFPTKLGESMAAGVPVIANITSDIGQYLTDNEEGLVCNSEGIDDCKNSLKRALKLNQEQKNEMKEKARKRAKFSFHYENYIRNFSEFLKRI